MTCNVLKYILNGFFMSVYRLICMKKPNIALNVQKQRKIINRLIVLELMTLIVFHGLYTCGTKMRGTSLGLAMLRHKP